MVHRTRKNILRSHILHCAHSFLTWIISLALTLLLLETDSASLMQVVAKRLRRCLLRFKLPSPAAAVTWGKGNGCYKQGERGENGRRHEVENSLQVSVDEISSGRNQICDKNKIEGNRELNTSATYFDLKLWRDSANSSMIMRMFLLSQRAPRKNRSWGYIP